MKTIFIIHGAGGHPQENWFPWLKKELEKLNCRVIVPQFPTDPHTLKGWLNVFKEYSQSLDENTILVGHSLGVPFILNILEQQHRPIQAAFLAAGFVGLPHNRFDDIVRTFSDKQFNWTKIKENCRKFYVFHSDNDLYVSLEKGQGLAKTLDTKLILIKNGGHLNQTSGYTKFPLLLEKIEKEV